VRQRDLLAAISKLQPIHLKGTFERHTSLLWGELQPSAAGGRWGARRTYEVLYLGRPRSSIVIEAYRHLIDDELDDGAALAASVLERRVVTCEVDIANVLDIRASTALGAVSLVRRNSFRMSAITPPAKPSGLPRTSSDSPGSSRRPPAGKERHSHCSPPTSPTSNGPRSPSVISGEVSHPILGAFGSWTKPDNAHRQGNEPACGREHSARRFWPTEATWWAKSTGKRRNPGGSASRCTPGAWLARAVSCASSRVSYPASHARGRRFETRRAPWRACINLGARWMDHAVPWAHAVRS
jgi:hypothetical protein